MNRFPVLLIMVLLGASASAVSCGHDTAAGTYKWSSGELTMLRDLTLVLEDDGTFSLTGTTSVPDEEWDVEGTWEQDGTTVRLVAARAGETATEVGEYRDGSLSWEGVVWEKR